MSVFRNLSKNFICLMMCICAITNVVAQGNSANKVSGTVTDTSGEPLIGVSIVIKGTQQGTISDMDGNFSLSYPAELKNPILVSTYIGYKPQEISVNGDNLLKIVMEEDTQNLEEVVVVGYGTQKKVNLSGAVEAVGGKTLENRSVSNVGTMLQGVIPNLNISMDGGQSNQTPSFNIRGETSLNGGSPLILVDGVPIDESSFSRMNSADIESISVLKDASSAAIYGARAAFGVIIVTTKKGKGEKPTVNFSNTLNIRKLGRQPKVVMDPYIQASYKDIMGAPWYDLYSTEELEYAKQRSENPGLPSTMINPREPEKYSYLGCTDWFNELYSQTGLSHSHNLSLSGSAKSVDYYLGVEYFGEEGMVRYNTDSYNRYNIRNKVDYKINDYLKIGNNTSLMYYTYDAPTLLDNWFYKEIHNANALHIPRNPDGSWTETGAKYMGALMYGGDSKTRELNAQTQFTLDLTLVKDVLKIHSDFTARFWNKQVDLWQSDIDLLYKDGPNSAFKDLGWKDYASGTHSNSRFTLFNVYADFNKNWSGHNLAAIVGFEQESESLQYFSGSRDQLITTSAPNLTLATGEKTVSDERYSWATRSGFARINYTLFDRYILEANGRYDGTSRFKKSSRFGFFPSVSAAWVISQEKFFQPLTEWFNLAKIRVSYGSLGNQNVGYYEYISNMGSYEVDAVIDGKKPVGVGSPYLISNSLTWERVETKNIGADISFLRNRLTVSGDVYRRDTKDMLTDGPALPGVLGVPSPRQNAADLKTRGWEASITWRDQLSLGGKPINYSIRGVVSDSRSFITKFENPTKSLDHYYEGYELGSIWGLTTLGFFRDEADIKNSPDQWEVTAYPGDRPIEAGDLKYKNLNGDDKINGGAWTLDDSGDFSIIGNTSPRYNFGLDLNADWHGFDLRIFLQGVGKKDWYPNLFSFFGIYRAPWSNVYTNNLDHWTPENPNGYFPRLKSYTAEVSGDMKYAQTRYLQNAAYVRIKNITIGYTLPKQITQKVKIDRARFYFTGDNVGEFTALCKNYDPEGLNLTHPMQRIFSFGLNLTF